MGQTTMLRSLISLAIAIAIPLIVGGIGGFATTSSLETWYTSLVKPAWNPPNWLFGPVWTLLYILMGIALWRIWRLGTSNPEVQSALFFFGLQLIFNLGWSLLFFGAQRPDLALIEILVLLALILTTLLRFYPLDRLAAWLLVPYLIWSTFATALNGAIWWLNR